MNTLSTYTNDSPSEGIQFALRFIRNQDLNPEEIASTGKLAVDLLRQRLSDIENARGLTHFVWGGVIHRLRQKDAWRAVEWPNQEGWWSFGDFCQNVLKMSIIKAGILERIWRGSQAVGMEPEEIEHIGWNCSVQILRAAEKRADVDYWLKEFADAPNRETFIEKIRESIKQKHEGIPPKGIQHVRQIPFATQEQAVFFDECLERAAQIMGKVVGLSIGQRDCLLFICTQWREFVAEKET